MWTPRLDYRVNCRRISGQCYRRIIGYPIFTGFGTKLEQMFAYFKGRGAAIENYEEEGL
jgi:hypothetical protein